MANEIDHVEDCDGVYQFYVIVDGSQRLEARLLTAMPEISASLMSQPSNVCQLGQLGVFGNSKNEPAVFAHVPKKDVLT